MDKLGESVLRALLIKALEDLKAQAEHGEYWVSRYQINTAIFNSENEKVDLPNLLIGLKRSGIKQHENQVLLGVKTKLKTQMAMDMLRCKSPDLVQKEIAIYFLAYNLIRTCIARSAVVKRKIPRLISFMTTVQLFNEGVLKLTLLSGKALKYAIDNLLKAIASILIDQTKRTPQPRAIKRRPKPCPLLTVHGKQACKEIVTCV